MWGLRSMSVSKAICACTKIEATNPQHNKSAIMTMTFLGHDICSPRETKIQRNTPPHPQGSLPTERGGQHALSKHQLPPIKPHVPTL